MDDWKKKLVSPGSGQEGYEEWKARMAGKWDDELIATLTAITRTAEEKQKILDGTVAFLKKDCSLYFPYNLIHGMGSKQKIGSLEKETIIVIGVTPTYNFATVYTPNTAELVLQPIKYVNPQGYTETEAPNGFLVCRQDNWRYANGEEIARVVCHRHSLGM